MEQNHRDTSFRLGEMLKIQNRMMSAVESLTLRNDRLLRVIENRGGSRDEEKPKKKARRSKDFDANTIMAILTVLYHATEGSVLTCVEHGNCALVVIYNYALLWYAKKHDIHSVTMISDVMAITKETTNTSQQTRQLAKRAMAEQTVVNKGTSRYLSVHLLSDWINWLSGHLKGLHWSKFPKCASLFISKQTISNIQSDMQESIAPRTNPKPGPNWDTRRSQSSLADVCSLLQFVEIFLECGLLSPDDYTCYIGIIKMIISNCSQEEKEEHKEDEEQEESSGDEKDDNRAIDIVNPMFTYNDTKYEIFLLRGGGLFLASCDETIVVFGAHPLLFTMNKISAHDDLDLADSKNEGGRDWTISVEDRLTNGENITTKNMDNIPYLTINPIFIQRFHRQNGTPKIDVKYVRDHRDKRKLRNQKHRVMIETI